LAKFGVLAVQKQSGRDVTDDAHSVVQTLTGPPVSTQASSPGQSATLSHTMVQASGVSGTKQLSMPPAGPV